MPNPPGATAEIQEVTGQEPELLRHREMLEAVCGAAFPWPAGRFSGRGIVICGGGEKYFPSVYVLVRLLRHLGCALPIEVWHLGAAEMSAEMRGLLAEHGVVCVDGLAVRRLHPARRLGGWELKCHALLHCAFAEVLLLDADNCPVRDPSFLFDAAEYRKTGAVFWPDYKGFAEGQAVWEASGIRHRSEPEFESGQILVSKARCWRALHVAMHLNEHSDWWYRLVHGDKDTFHLAWRKIGQAYAMPSAAPLALESTIVQHDFAGERLFQHRNFAKWQMDQNPHIIGFRLEKECLGYLADLRESRAPGMPRGVRRWDPRRADAGLRAIARALCSRRWDYARIGLDARPIRFLPDGSVGEGAAGCERWWDLRLVKTTPGTARTAQLEVFGEEGLTFRARPSSGDIWKGAWVAFERNEVVLRPIRVRTKDVENAGLRMQECSNGGEAGEAAFFRVPKRDGKDPKAVVDVPEPRREAAGNVARRRPKDPACATGRARAATPGSRTGSNKLLLHCSRS